MPISKFPTTLSFDGEMVSLSFTSPDTISKYNWSSQVKIRQYNSILTLYGIQSENHYSCPCQIGKQTLPLCKSNLQKCVRRKDTDRALRTALAMYSHDPNEVLRRISVIMIEDCLVYPTGLVKIVFWMCAVSKGYRMSVKEISDMLGIITTMCESYEYDVPRSLDELHRKDYSTLQESQRTSLWCLELRTIYGGMAHDKRMFYYHINMWYDRFTEKDSVWHKKTLDQDEYEIDLNSVDVLSKDDILIEAFDHHPYPWLGHKIAVKFQNLQQLLEDDKRENISKTVKEGNPHEKGLWVVKDFPQYMSEKDVTSAIWDCRSRINFRSPIDNSIFRKTSVITEKIFKIIEKDVNKFSIWLRYRLNLKD